MNDGGPAFPMPSGPEPQVNAATHFNEGMSLRDYLIAHAPLVPYWFDVEMPTPKPEQQITPVGGNMVEIKDGGPAWEKDREWLRWTQWPIAWADAMLAEREQQSHSDATFAAQLEGQKENNP